MAVLPVLLPDFPAYVGQPTNQPTNQPADWPTNGRQLVLPSSLRTHKCSPKLTKTTLSPPFPFPHHPDMIKKLKPDVEFKPRKIFTPRMIRKKVPKFDSWGTKSGRGSLKVTYLHTYIYLGNFLVKDLPLPALGVENANIQENSEKIKGPPGDP